MLKDVGYGAEIIVSLEELLTTLELEDDEVQVDVGVGVGVGVDDGVEVVGVSVGGGVSSASEDEVLLLEEEVLGGGGGGATWVEGAGFEGCWLSSCEPLPLELPSLLLLPLPPTSVTTNLAELPAGTVTTQDTAPPAPVEPPPPTSSLTPCCDGSMAHGRPLQPPPSHSISIPNVGFSSRNGVAGSR